MTLETLTECQRELLRRPLVEQERLAMALAIEEEKSLCAAARRLSIGRSTLYRRSGELGVFKKVLSAADAAQAYNEGRT